MTSHRVPLVGEHGQVTEEAIEFFGNMNSPLTVVSSVGFNNTHALKELIAGREIHWDESPKSAVAYCIIQEDSTPLVVLDANLDPNEDLDPRTFCLLVSELYGIRQTALIIGKRSRPCYPLA